MKIINLIKAMNKIGLTVEETQYRSYESNWDGEYVLSVTHRVYVCKKGKKSCSFRSKDGDLAYWLKLGAEGNREIYYKTIKAVVEAMKGEG